MLPEEPTLLQTALATCPLGDDPELSWAFLLFCGLIESKAHDEFVSQVTAKGDDVVGLSEALLDVVTQRAELLDLGKHLALRLWQYFQVGRSLQPEVALGEAEEGTQPGVTGPVATLES